MTTNQPSTALSVRQAEGAMTLYPTNVSEVMLFAEQMAKGSLAPAHLKDKHADCFRIVVQASQWGFNPFAVAEKTSVISGKLMYEGQLVAAVVNSRGNLAERLNYKFEGEGTNRVLTVTGKIRGEAEERTTTLTYGQALKINRNGAVSGGDAEQQMCYIGARRWARRHMPELLLGVYTPDEMPDNDVIDVTVEGQTAEPAPAQRRRRSDKGLAAATATTEPKADAAMDVKVETVAEPVKEPAKEPAKVETAATDPIPVKWDGKPITALTAGQLVEGVECNLIKTTQGLTQPDAKGERRSVRTLVLKGGFDGTAYSFLTDLECLWHVGVVTLTILGKQETGMVRVFVTAAEVSAEQ